MKKCNKIQVKQLQSKAFISCDFPIGDVDGVVQNYKPKTEWRKLKQTKILSLDSLDKNICLTYPEFKKTEEADEKTKNTNDSRVYFRETEQLLDAKAQQH